MLRHHLGWYSPILERFCFIVTTLLIMQPVAFFYLSIYLSVYPSIYLSSIYKQEDSVQILAKSTDAPGAGALSHYRRYLGSPAAPEHQRPTATAATTGSPRCSGRQLRATAAGDSCGRQLQAACLLLSPPLVAHGDYQAACAKVTLVTAAVAACPVVAALGGGATRRLVLIRNDKKLVLFFVIQNKFLVIKY